MCAALEGAYAQANQAASTGRAKNRERTIGAWFASARSVTAVIGYD